MQKTRRGHWALLAIGIALFMLVAAIETAAAADSVIEFVPDSAVSRVDRNGNSYVRFIMSEQRELQGHQYQIGVPVMAFGDLAQKAASYPPGKTIKAIARHSQLPDGRESYSIVQFIE